MFALWQKKASVENIYRPFGVLRCCYSSCCNHRLSDPCSHLCGGYRNKIVFRYKSLFQTFTSFSFTIALSNPAAFKAISNSGSWLSMGIPSFLFCYKNFRASGPSLTGLAWKLISDYTVKHGSFCIFVVLFVTRCQHYSVSLNSPSVIVHKGYISEHF